MHQKYDIMIPLGESCITSGNLRRCKRQFESFPLDWILLDIEVSLQLLRNGFAGFLNNGDLRLIDRGKEHDRYLNDKLQIEFVHDFTDQSDLERDFPAVAAKYSNRIRRLYRRIEKAQNILFAFTSLNSFDAEQLEQIRLDLETIFPAKTIHLLFFELLKGPAGATTEIINSKLTKHIFTTPDINDWIGLRKPYRKALRPYRLTLVKRMAYIWPDWCFRIRKNILKLISLLAPTEKLRRKWHLKTKRNIFE